MVLRLRKEIAEHSSVVILLVLAVASLFFVSGFSRNLSSVILEASCYGFIAIGLSIVMLTGNIDLSVGFQAGLAAMVTVAVLNATRSIVAAIFAAILCGAVTGVINGFIVTALGINPLIGTIAANYIYKGIVFAYTRDGAFRANEEQEAALKSIFNTSLGLDVLTPAVIIILIAFVVLYLFLKRTLPGRDLYVVGDNPEAGKLAGIQVSKIVMFAYLLCGICCAAAGLFMASRSGGAVYTQGDGREVFAISVCIIGGIKMSGGKGTMFNVLVGLLIMRIISTAMNCMLIPSAWVDFVSGALLVLVLFFDWLTQKKKN